MSTLRLGHCLSLSLPGTQIQWRRVYTAAQGLAQREWSVYFTTIVSESQSLSVDTAPASSPVYYRCRSSLPSCLHPTPPRLSPSLPRLHPPPYIAPADSPLNSELLEGNAFKMSNEFSCTPEGLGWAHRQLSASAEWTDGRTDGWMDRRMEGMK